MTSEKRIGLLGAGALGAIIGREILNRVFSNGRLSSVLELESQKLEEALGSGSSDLWTSDIDEVIERSDIIIEALPPKAAARYLPLCFKAGKTVIPLTLSVLLTHEEDFRDQEKWPGRMIIPSGSIAGLDGIRAMRRAGLEKARIVTTKSPASLREAPFLKDRQIKPESFIKPECLFKGSVREGAGAFPANVNVAVALAYCGIGADETLMEIRVDPQILSNEHRIIARAKTGSLDVTLKNRPDPDHPGSSRLAAYSVLNELDKILLKA